MHFAYNFFHCYYVFPIFSQRHFSEQKLRFCRYARKHTRVRWHLYPMLFDNAYAWMNDCIWYQNFGSFLLSITIKILKVMSLASIIIFLCNVAPRQSRQTAGTGEKESFLFRASRITPKKRRWYDGDKGDSIFSKRTEKMHSFIYFLVDDIYSFG